MRFIETALCGAYIIEPELIEDDRGFFTRSYCQNAFAQWGLKGEFVQCNISFNKKRGTLRGMHFQGEPCEEAKLVRCTMGAIFDVIIDLRASSKTFKQWVSVELTASNRKALYIPQGFAHGFITLQDQSEVFYQMSEFYSAEHARGVRWDDPIFGIKWPEQPSIISQKDASYVQLSLNSLS